MTIHHTQFLKRHSRESGNLRFGFNIASNAYSRFRGSDDYFFSHFIFSKANA
jgi:hypothetical protein